MGNKSGSMVALYTRTWEELGVGTLRPLDALVPDPRPQWTLNGRRSVARAGIEPATRGFSGAFRGRPICKRSRRLGPFVGPTAAPVPQLIRIVLPRTGGRSSQDGGKVS